MARVGGHVYTGVDLGGSAMGLGTRRGGSRGFCYGLGDLLWIGGYMRW
jgi:hypothetical protein